MAMEPKFIALMIGVALCDFSKAFSRHFIYVIQEIVYHFFIPGKDCS